MPLNIILRLFSQLRWRLSNKKIKLLSLFLNKQKALFHEIKVINDKNATYFESKILLKTNFLDSQ